MDVEAPGSPGRINEEPVTRLFPPKGTEGEPGLGGKFLHRTGSLTAKATDLVSKSNLRIE
jgi:hypothetical protein